MTVKMDIQSQLIVNLSRTLYLIVTLDSFNPAQGYNVLKAYSKYGCSCWTGCKSLSVTLNIVLWLFLVLVIYISTEDTGGSLFC